MAPELEEDDRPSHVGRPADGPAPPATIRGSTLWKLAAILALTYTIIHVVGAVTALLFVAFGGIILGAYFSGLARLLERKSPLGYRPSIALVFVGHLIALGLLVPWWLAQGQPQAAELMDQLPRAVSDVASRLEGTGWGAWLMSHAPSAGDVLATMEGGAVDGVRKILSGVGGLLGAAGLLLFIGLYVSVEPELYCRGVVMLVPSRRRGRAQEVLDRLAHTLRMWVAGRVVSAAVIGTGVALGLWALGIPLPAMLGLLAAILTFIPNFGPMLSVVPPALFALTESPTKVIWVLGLFAGLQFVETYALTPIIERRAVQLPPALLLAVQIILGLLAGIVGLALAAPLTAVAIVLVRELYVRDVLGTDPDEDEVLTTAT